jgi:hypothetical protein
MPLHSQPSTATGGGLPSNVRTITAATATAANGDVMLCDATSNAITITLPATGSVFVVKTDAGANSVVVDAAGGGTVDGDAGGLSLDYQDHYALVSSTAANTFRRFSDGPEVTGIPTGAEGDILGYDADGALVAITPGDPSASDIPATAITGSSGTGRSRASCPISRT